MSRRNALLKRKERIEKLIEIVERRIVNTEDPELEAKLLARIGNFN